ncbi:MAG: hypothetical protein ACI4OS_07955 [Akkermansia sp.]
MKFGCAYAALFAVSLLCPAQEESPEAAAQADAAPEASFAAGQEMLEPCREALEQLTLLAREAADCVSEVRDAETAQAAAPLLAGYLPQLLQAQEALGEALDAVPAEHEAELTELLDVQWPLLCAALEPLGRAADAEPPYYASPELEEAINSLADVNDLFAQLLVPLDAESCAVARAYVRELAARAAALEALLAGVADAAGASAAAEPVAAARAALSDALVMASAYLAEAPVKMQRRLLLTARESGVASCAERLRAAVEVLLGVDAYGDDSLRLELMLLQQELNCYSFLVDEGGFRLLYAPPGESAAE